MRAKSLYLLVGVVAIILIVFGVLLLQRKQASSDTSLPSTASAASAVDTGPRIAPARCGQPEGATCVEYRNEKYHFSIFRSSLKEVKEFDEGGGASTVTFENLNDVRGWQLFVVPYGAAQVTEQRFRKDVPSGVRTNVQDITVDGAVGAAFYSKDASLGETFEVWFVHDGFLYELTTLKSLEPNLRERLATWKFI